MDGWMDEWSDAMICTAAQHHDLKVCQIDIGCISASGISIRMDMTF